jgi:hypothetical protein
MYVILCLTILLSPMRNSSSSANTLTSAPLPSARWSVISMYRNAFVERCYIAVCWLTGQILSVYRFARLRSYLVISAEMRRWQKGGRRPYAKRKFEAITTEVTSPKTLSSSDELELDPVESVDDENVPSSAEALVAPQLPVSSHSAQRGRPPQPIPESYYNDPVIELPRALIIPAVGDDMLTRWRKIEARDFIMKAYGLEY